MVEKTRDNFSDLIVTQSVRTTQYPCHLCQHEMRNPYAVGNDFFCEPNLLVIVA